MKEQWVLSHYIKLHETTSETGRLALHVANVQYSTNPSSLAFFCLSSFQEDQFVIDKNVAAQRWLRQPQNQSQALLPFEFGDFVLLNLQFKKTLKTLGNTTEYFPYQKEPLREDQKLGFPTNIAEP